MKISFKTYSLAALQHLLARVQTEIRKRGDKNRKAVLRELRRIAKKSGFDLASLVGGNARVPRNTRPANKRRIDRRQKVAPKYRHPKEKRLTWTGRGRKPKWIQEWLGGKGTLEQLAIKK